MLHVWLTCDKIPDEEIQPERCPKGGEGKNKLSSPVHLSKRKPEVESLLPAIEAEVIPASNGVGNGRVLGKKKKCHH